MPSISSVSFNEIPDFNYEPLVVQKVKPAKPGSLISTQFEKLESMGYNSDASLLKIFARDHQLSNSLLVSLLAIYIFNGALPSETVLEKLLRRADSDPQFYSALQQLENSLSKESALKPQLKEVIARKKALEKWDGLKLHVEGTFDRIQAAKEIKILTDYRLVYAIAAFQNAGEAQKAQHAIVYKNGCLHIPIANRLQPVSILKNEPFYWDSQECLLATKIDGKIQRWAYYSNPGNVGLIPYDRFYHQEENPPEHNKKLIPTMEISNEEMGRLQKVAQEFYPEGDPRREGKAVIQIVTNQMKELGGSPLMINANREWPTHVHFRIIVDGKVYTTGFGYNRLEYKAHEGIGQFFSTINGQPVVLDDYDTRAHKGRITTNVAISEEKAAELLKSLNTLRGEGVRFNLARQNCAYGALQSLVKAGAIEKEELPRFKTTLFDKVWRAVPGLDMIPGTVGHATRGLENKGIRLIKFCKSLIPVALQVAITWIKAIAFFLPSKVMTVIFNLLILALSGSKSGPTKPPNQVDEDFPVFPTHIQGIGDIFSDDTSSIWDSSEIVRWQLEKDPTVFTPPTKVPSLALLPEESDEKMKEKLIELYC